MSFMRNGLDKALKIKEEKLTAQKLEEQKIIEYQENKDHTGQALREVSFGGNKKYPAH